MSLTEDVHMTDKDVNMTDEEDVHMTDEQDEDKEFYKTKQQKDNEADGSSSSKKIKQLQEKCKKGTCLVRYHANWCPHCVNMQSQWNKYVGGNLEHNVISFEEKAINKMNPPPSVNGYPTIKLLKGGKEVAEFNEDKTAENFKKFYESRGSNKSELDNIDEMVGGMHKNIKLKWNLNKKNNKKQSTKNHKNNDKKQSTKNNKNNNKKQSIKKHKNNNKKKRTNKK